MAHLWVLNPFMGNTDASRTKLNEHCNFMTIHNCFKFNEIPFIGYLVTTQFVEFIAI